MLLLGVVLGTLSAGCEGKPPSPKAARPPVDAKEAATEKTPPETKQPDRQAPPKQTPPEPDKTEGLDVAKQPVRGPHQPDPPKKPAKIHRNRLADESSPYLLLHAHNPVDWFPWGNEALAKAKLENKLIFLSIGYSSCYWCHVMERESFMDEEIAAYLNEHYVCIKIDREERPDIDSIYARALLLVSNGRGGWPMSMFLAPDTNPFFGVTYLPARDDDRPGMTGFLPLIKNVQKVWEEKHDEIISGGQALAGAVESSMRGRLALQPVQLDEELIQQVQQSLAEQYDAVHGGFGGQPKFPEPSNLHYLLHRAEGQDEAARDMLVATLEKMAMGGIRDHLGGGFHRYSVDRYWRIPHFEKMLYDNGQLASVYVEAHRLTGREDFARVAEEMVEFVLRELAAPEGGFYTSLDAESESEEGKFYRWEKAELENLLDGSELASLAPVYGFDGEPNFEHEGHHGYVPLLSKPLSEIAAAENLSETQLETKLAPIRKKLLAARNLRTRPATDTKILTSWNGLMIRGLADAGRGLDKPHYVHAAAEAADFLMANLRTEDGRLMRTYGPDGAKLNAYLDDYAFLVDGLIALYQATHELRWLIAADELTAKQIELFWDERGGGFFFTSDDHETLIARGKNPIDGVLPSGNSVAADNLVFLAAELEKADYLDRAEATIQSSLGMMEGKSAAAPRLAVTVARLLLAKSKSK